MRPTASVYICEYTVLSTEWSAGILSCLQLLLAAPHLSCGDDAWETSRIYAFLSLSLWGIAAPVVIAIVMEVRAKSRAH